MISSLSVDLHRTLYVHRTHFLCNLFPNKLFFFFLNHPPPPDFSPLPLPASLPIGGEGPAPPLLQGKKEGEKYRGLTSTNPPPPAPPPRGGGLVFRFCKNQRGRNRHKQSRDAD